MVGACSFLGFDRTFMWRRKFSHGFSQVPIGWGLVVAVLVAYALFLAFGSWKYPVPVFGSVIQPPSYNTVLNNTTPLTKRTNLNLVNSGCTDNAGTSSTDCTLAKLTVVANVGALPTMNCNPGDLAIVNAAALGQQIYENSGSGACTWTQQAGAGGGSGGVSTYSNTTQTFAAGTVFLPAGGGGAFNATEAAVQVGSPAAATITNMFVQVSTALPGATSLAFTWRKNGASQTVTCTVPAAGTTCSDTTHSFAVVQGDLVDIQVVVTGAVGAETVQILSQYGTTGSNGTVNTGTINQTAFYAVAGTAVSGAGPGAAGQCWTSNGAAMAPSFQACAGGGPAPTSGTFSALPACNAGNNNLLYFFTNSGAYTDALCNNPNWLYFGNGQQFTPPPSAGWTADNLAAGSTWTFTNGPGYGSFQPNAATQMQAEFRTAPATPYTVTACFQQQAVNASGASVTLQALGLIFRDGTGKIVYWYYENDASQALTHTQKWNTSASFNSAYTDGAAQQVYGWGQSGHPFFCLSERDDGVNLIFRESFDGQNFIQYDSRSRTDFFAAGPTQIGIGARVEGASTHMESNLIHWTAQ